MSGAQTALGRGLHRIRKTCGKGSERKQGSRPGNEVQFKGFSLTGPSGSSIAPSD